ncbi:hypothetical protein LOCC1_G003170, partial [Lachnellula occidentalis]
MMVYSYHSVTNSIRHTEPIPTIASGDWYGKLYIYIHNMMKRFLDRLQKTRIGLVLYNVDARELPQLLEHNKYARLEVANICDGAYIGIRNTLSLLSPLLQSPQQNPHATFITLFINAVKEAVKWEHSTNESPNMQFLGKYLPFPRSLDPNDADTYRIWDARDLALDVDKYFSRYMEFCNFEQISVDLGVQMKESNTIAEKWPTQLKLEAGQECPHLIEVYTSIKI